MSARPGLASAAFYRLRGGQPATRYMWQEESLPWWDDVRVVPRANIRRLWPRFAGDKSARWEMLSLADALKMTGR